MSLVYASRLPWPLLAVEDSRKARDGILETGVEIAVADIADVSAAIGTIITPVAEIDMVVAAQCVDCIVAAVAENKVVEAGAEDHVIACAAVDEGPIEIRRSIDPVIAVIAVDRGIDAAAADPHV